MRKGFTLVELLVVVLVMAVLLALLSPALRGARERARETRCRANMRQIVTGVVLYATQFGRFPVDASPESLDMPVPAFWCPSDPREIPGILSYGQNPDGSPILYGRTAALSDSFGPIVLLKERQRFHAAGVNHAYSDGHVRPEP